MIRRRRFEAIRGAEEEDGSCSYKKS